MSTPLADPTLGLAILIAVAVLAVDLGLRAAIRRRRARLKMPDLKGGRRSLGRDAALLAAVPVRRLRATGAAAPAPVADPSDPLDGLRGCTIRHRGRLMGREQGRVYAALLDWAVPLGLRVSTEVSMSAIFTVSHASRREQLRGFGKVRQKYVDFLILDAECRPLCGVEYHGTGHFQGDAAARDAIKRFAFARAGLPLIEMRHDAPVEAGIAAVAQATGHGPTLRIAAE